MREASEARLAARVCSNAVSRSAYAALRSVCAALRSAYAALRSARAAAVA